MSAPPCPQCLSVMVETGTAPATSQTSYRCACGYRAVIWGRPDGTSELLIYDTNNRVVQSVRRDKEDP